MHRYSLVILVFCLLASSASFGQKVTINHTAIFVVDCKVSAKFYHDVVGLDTIAEPFHDGKHVWMKTGPKSALHIIEGSTGKKEYYKNQHTCYSVPSVDKFVEVLKKNKIEFEDVQGNKNVYSMRPDKVKQLWLRDPDGYWLEINDAKE